MNERSAGALIVELEALGVTIRAEGGDLRLTGTPARLTPALQARVVLAKPHLLAALLQRRGGDNAQRVVTHDAHDPATGSSPLAQTLREPLECAARTDVDVACPTVLGTMSDPPVSSPSTAAPIVVDFETRSAVSLDQLGGRRYAAHPSTEILCAVFILPGGTVIDWTPSHVPPTAVFNLVAAGVPVLAHNAHGFDRFVWERLGWPPTTWIDSLPLARLLGLPGKLEAIAAALLDVQKDTEGRAVTLAATRLDRAGRLPDLDPPTVARILTYCRVDTLILKRAWDARLASAMPIEPVVRKLDARINERGFQFDSHLADAIIDCERGLAEEARRDAHVDTRVLASTVKLKHLLATAGVSLVNVRRETLLPLLDNPDLGDDVRRIVVARLASSGINGHKLSAALRRVSDDGRLRDSLAYCQAHTGRWSGRGFQPQNLPRGAKFKDGVDLEDAVAAVSRGDTSGLIEIATAIDASVHEVCASLVRACVCAPPGRTLGIADYASIEARALHWLAANEDGLEGFRRRSDPYREMAGMLFRLDAASVTDRQRALGKALVLGCGYQMGGERFETYAATFGVDWSTLNINPKQAVEAWRSAHPAIAGRLVPSGARVGGLWQAMHDAADRAARGARVTLGPLAWERHDGDVVCVLPSGRPLFYRNVRIELRQTKWGQDRWTFTYEHRGQRVATYGGKLTENVTQAICRDLLADALVRVEEKGIPVVLHVHDEIVAELDEPSQLDEMKAIMCDPPSWAAGLPLHAEGDVSARYRK